MNTTQCTSSSVCRHQLTVLMVVLVAFVGCQRFTTVSGTVTLDGRPLEILPNSRGTVVFHPNGGQGAMATALLDEAGHFSLTMGSSKEIAPGKYYVTVAVAQAPTRIEGEEQSTELITPQKYASARDSGIEAEVKPGENRLTFNLLSKPDSSDANSPAAPPDQTKAAAHADAPVTSATK